MTVSKKILGTRRLPSRPWVHGRRGVLGLLGGIPALLALGACSADDSETLAESGCAPGATAPRPSERWDDGPEAGDVRTDDSVLAPGAIAMSPDGTLIAANAGLGRKRSGASESAGTTVWNTADGTIAARFDNELTGAIAWHPNGSLLAIGGPEHLELTALDGEVLWTLTGHSPTQASAGVRSLAFTPDGTTLASLGGDGAVRLWRDIGSGCTPGDVLDVRGLSPQSLSISPDGSTLAIAGTDGPVELWDLANGERSDTVEDVEFFPRAVRYAPDGTLLIGTGVALEHSASAPEHARLYALSPQGTLQEAPTPPGSTVAHLAITADSARVAVTAEADPRVVIWDRGTGDLVDLPRVPGSAGALAFDPEGSRLSVSARTEGLTVWDGSSWGTSAIP